MPQDDIVDVINAIHEGRTRSDCVTFYCKHLLSEFLGQYFAWLKLLARNIQAYKIAGCEGKEESGMTLCSLLMNCGYIRDEEGKGMQ